MSWDIPGIFRDRRGPPTDSNFYRASKNPSDWASVTLKGFLVGDFASLSLTTEHERTKRQTKIKSKKRTYT